MLGFPPHPLSNVGDRRVCLKFVKYIATLDRGYGGPPNIGLGVRGRGLLSPHWRVAFVSATPGTPNSVFGGDQLGWLVFSWFLLCCGGRGVGGVGQVSIGSSLALFDAGSHGCRRESACAGFSRFESEVGAWCDCPAGWTVPGETGACCEACREGSLLSSEFIGCVPAAEGPDLGAGDFYMFLGAHTKIEESKNAKLHTAHRKNSCGYFE